MDALHHPNTRDVTKTQTALLSTVRRGFSSAPEIAMYTMLLFTKSANFLLQYEPTTCIPKSAIFDTNLIEGHEAFLCRDGSDSMGQAVVVAHG